ncbi:MULTISPECIES: ComEA family DNA-binding protein [Paraburkholderia]|uniref:Helix-hairpin-helix domain-containing protein n=1 Tax=Paraburkholderia unamae TaxID=219649 RepID=A0ACC6RW43_9BURK
MFRKVLAAAALLAVFSHAFAAVDVNTANEDALRGIKGVGPARARAILDERSAHGPYKDASDLGKRVKGMGGHTVERLQAEGLAIGPAQSQAAQAKVAQATPAKAGAQQAAVAVKK